MAGRNLYAMSNSMLLQEIVSVANQLARSTTHDETQYLYELLTEADRRMIQPTPEVCWPSHPECRKGAV